MLHVLRRLDPAAWEMQAWGDYLAQPMELRDQNATSGVAGMEAGDPSGYRHRPSIVCLGFRGNGA
jgi:hypothetical protein